MISRTTSAFCIALALSIAAVSCNRRAPEPLAFEETPVISGGLGWAVVSIAYARLLSEPDAKAADAGTARRGDIARIAARERFFRGGSAEVWYRLELGPATGWLRNDAVSVYRNEAEARKAAGHSL